MIALRKEKREELTAFINASIEQRCTVYTLAKQRELEAMRDQVALASLTARNIKAKSRMHPGCKFPVIKIESLEFPIVGALEDAESIACELSDLYISPPVPEIKLPHELMDLVNAVEFYHAVKAENPKVETGMWKDAYDWIKKAAVEAAPVIKRLNGLGE